MVWIRVAAVWILLLVLSVAIYKVVQKLARRSYARASRVEYPEDVGGVEEPAEQPIREWKQLEEPQPQEILPEKLAEAKPSKKKKEIQKNPLLEYIEDWKEPEAAPAAVKPVIREKATEKPRRGKVISPAKYPECFGTDYKLEKCKKDCGVVEECIKAVEVLQRM
ncbi:MAG: hypothetical protein HY930_00390 [Euryarchaeota archaeon]|nr:hypothetical protein [Euryarchaeota archaeon]